MHDQELRRNYSGMTDCLHPWSNSGNFAPTVFRRSLAVRVPLYRNSRLAKRLVHEFEQIHVHTTFMLLCGTTGVTNDWQGLS